MKKILYVQGLDVQHSNIIIVKLMITRQRKSDRKTERKRKNEEGRKKEREEKTSQ